MSYHDMKWFRDNIKKNQTHFLKNPAIYPSFTAFLLAACGGGGGGGSSNINQSLDTVTTDLVNIKTSTLKVLNGQTATITLTFNNTPINFSSQNLSVTNGSLTGGAFDASGLIFTSTFVPNGSTNGENVFVTVDNQWQSASGTSLNSAITSVPILVDTIIPSTSVQATAKEGGGVGEMDIIITFSDVPQNFNMTSDLSVSSGVLSGGSFDSSGKIFSLTYTK